MKKITKIILVVVIVVMALGIGITVLCMKLFSPKDALTADEFKTVMVQKGFQTADITEKYSSYNIKKYYLALAPDESYQIDFLECNDTVVAKNLYAGNKAQIEATKGNASMTSEASVSNYSKYSQTSNGSFQVISRIDNTLLMIVTEDDLKDTVKDLLDDIGY